MLVEFNLNLDVLLSVANVATLHILEVNDVIKLVIGVEFGDQPILLESGEGRLLIPTNGRLSEINATDPRLESQIGRNRVQECRCQSVVPFTVKLV